MEKSSHVSEAKKKLVSELVESINSYRSILIVSIKGLPSKQFQDIKKKLRDVAKIKCVKKNLVKIAFEKSKKENLVDLSKYYNENCALLFGNEDSFEISKILSKERSPQKAKPGQIAPRDIEIKAGPTKLAPGPDISLLSSVGLAPKIEGGKINIANDKVIVKKGEEINEKVATILSKLDITPFEVGIEPIAAYMDGKVYEDIKIDVEETIKSLEESYSKALAFAVEVCYYCKDTIDYILGRASIEEKAIEELLNSQNK